MVRRMGARRAFVVVAIVTGFGQACSLGNDPGLSLDGGGGSSGEDAALACAGHAQQQMLTCRGGTWHDNGACGSDTHCNTEIGGFAGTCLPILPDCVGKPAGTQICRGARPDVCNADSVNTDLAGVAYPSCRYGCLDAECLGRSCSGLASNCGPRADESCCRTMTVAGGSFFQTFDDRGSLTDPATLSDFALDRFEVTVGRFRAFVTAWVGGYRPPKGAGTHSAVHGGSGLVVGPSTDAAVSFETGWDTAWAAKLATTLDDWNGRLVGGSCMWTTTPGSNEALPITCVTWYEAYAFAIWDGGHLPTRAEWTYAAAGGAQQRVLPWSSPRTSLASDCSYANYQGATAGKDPCVGAPTRVGFFSPKGDGTYGQADLAGNVAEWVLDPYVQSPPAPCDDCVAAPADANRVTENGDFRMPLPGIVIGAVESESPDVRSPFIGFRVASR